MNLIMAIPQFAREQNSRMKEARTLAVLRMQQGGEKKQYSFEDLFRCRRKTVIDENGIANLHLYGFLGSKFDPIWKIFGLVTDYDDVAQEIATLKADPRCIGIFVDAESGGGMALGCGPTAELLADLAKTPAKPVLAYSDYVAASACYYIACSPGLFYASKDAILGSIGTRADWFVYQGYLEELGISAVELTGKPGTLKHAGTDLRPPTAEEMEFLQASIDQTNSEFVSHVRASRPGISEEAFKAGYYSGAKALELGLADLLCTREQAYDDLLALAKAA